MSHRKLKDSSEITYLITYLTSHWCEKLSRRLFFVSLSASEGRHLLSPGFRSLILSLVDSKPFSCLLIEFPMFSFAFSFFFNLSEPFSFFPGVSLPHSVSLLLSLSPMRLTSLLFLRECLCRVSLCTPLTQALDASIPLSLFYPVWCQTRLVGQSEGLSISRLSVRFRQKIKHR